MLFDSEREKLRKDYADCIVEREVCNNQYRSTIDEAQRVRLKRKLDGFDKQINELERQLSGQDLTADANRRSRALEEKLPKIDFKKQIGIVKDILEQFAEYGAALFFINDSFNMAGDLFSLELKNCLKDETTDLKHYEIAFSVDRRLDEIGFLQGLGGYLGIDEINSKEEYSKVIEKFFGFIENGSIVFIELRKIDLLDDKENFLSWLVDFFWKSLVEELPLICKNKDIEQVKFIILVTSDDDIFDECSSLPFFCHEESFDIYQIFAILLTEWSEKEIHLWLTKHSGLPKKKITPIAKSVYKSSRGGTPKLICDALKNKLN
ncbi:MAG: hypothetical protein KME57_13215 [Scytonema hyalinum WJT4-NPBG1]|jgi:hypothetical protein|nr:hypothetical protein [Scytonema hyalinum WJT4-NPBG1]